MSFDNMGKPIPDERRDGAYALLRTWGVSRDMAWGAVQAASSSLERDHPHEAMQQLRKVADETGVYRIMAVLLTDNTTVTVTGEQNE